MPIPEESVWEEAIYRLRNTDPIEGGPVQRDAAGNITAGWDNVQAEQLANRTRWLKDRMASEDFHAILFPDGLHVDGGEEPDPE
ncbi:MAG: hypothetical protein JJU00_13065 [Opitutales bacterium]|nr:hypothetical protein [Opitutales bacterium]